jgi:hypothetical protein
MAKKVKGRPRNNDQDDHDSGKLPPPAPTMKSMRTVPEPERWVAVPVAPELLRAGDSPLEAEPVQDIPEAKAELVGNARPVPKAQFEKPVRKVPKRSKDQGSINKGRLTNGAGGAGLRNRR